MIRVNLIEQVVLRDIKKTKDAMTKDEKAAFEKRMKKVKKERSRATALKRSKEGEFSRKAEQMKDEEYIPSRLQQEGGMKLYREPRDAD